jgi:DNA-binding transcriptional MerR regulator
MEYLTSARVCRLLAITKSTLFKYEKLMQDKPKKDKISGYRLWTKSNLKKLEQLTGKVIEPLTKLKKARLEACVIKWINEIREYEDSITKRNEGQNTIVFAYKTDPLNPQDFSYNLGKDGNPEPVYIFLEKMQPYLRDYLLENREVTEVTEEEIEYCQTYYEHLFIQKQNDRLKTLEKKYYTLKAKLDRLK